MPKPKRVTRPAKTAASTGGKTASKTAPAPKHGGARLPLGNHPGNTGGKKGRSGRKPDAYRRLMARLASRTETVEQLEKVLNDSSHPAFATVYKTAAGYGYGNPTQNVTFSPLTPDQLRAMPPAELLALRERVGK